MKNVQIFKYNENPIAFQMGEQKMINATQMSKAFGKQTKDFLRTEQTGELLSILSKRLNRPLADLVVVRKGGTSSGTWLHEDIAIVFAQWLSPEFYLWCNDRIKELFRFGLTATEDMLVKAATDPEFVVAMMDQVKQSRQQNRELAEQNNQLKAQIEENAHKVNFFDNVTNLDEDYNKRRTILISKVARKFKMSAPALNKFLIRKGVIVRVDGGYDIGPKYVGENIAWQNVKEKPEYNDDGDLVYAGRIYLEYYPKGVELIKELLSEAGLIK